MKRKYTRRVRLDNVESKSTLVESESNSLPPDIIKSIEKIVELRKSLGLYDDSKERIERALSYQEFIRGRKRCAIV